MAKIQPETQAARWIIPTLEIDGQTAVGEITGVNPALDADLIWAEGDAEFLAAAQGAITDYRPIPDVGEWCEAGMIYGYNSGLVICRQSHYRMYYPPEDTPALWMVYREEAGILEWIPNEPVSIGDLRAYNDVTYECIQAHVTQEDWTPDVTPALWRVYVEPQPYDEWAPYTAYTIGDIVTYLGIYYECRQSHTSLPGWEPPNVLALWLPITKSLQAAGVDVTIWQRVSIAVKRAVLSINAWGERINKAAAEWWQKLWSK